MPRNVHAHVLAALQGARMIIFRLAKPNDSRSTEHGQADQALHSVWLCFALPIHPRVRNENCWKRDESSLRQKPQKGAYSDTPFKSSALPQAHHFRCSVFAASLFAFLNAFKPGTSTGAPSADLLDLQHSGLHYDALKF